MKEKDFEAVVGFIDEAVQIAQGVKAQTGALWCFSIYEFESEFFLLSPSINFYSFLSLVGNLKEFKAFLLADAGTQSKIADLKSRVEAFADGYIMPGFQDR